MVYKYHNLSFADKESDLQFSVAGFVRGLSFDVHRHHSLLQPFLTFLDIFVKQLRKVSNDERQHDACEELRQPPESMFY